MSIDGYDGYEGSSARTRWGCGVACLIGMPLFGFLLLVDALGDCIPGSECRNGFFSTVLVPSAIVALATFFAARAFVGWLQRRNDQS